MVEVIWPRSVVPCQDQEDNGRSGVLPLRSFIETTLRRSRASYSTLQVALYYLVLVKPHVPKCDFTMEQTVDSAAYRSLQCGRRMFLAALILASKYLQDRNYSAKAWSKMSGLKVPELSMIERTFLAAVDWKLHIPEPLFKRWTDVVLRFTPSQLPPSLGQSTLSLDNKSAWKCIVPLLTPELDTLPMPTNVERTCPMKQEPGLASPTTPTPLHPKFEEASRSQETTPTPFSVPPRFLEPRPEVAPPTPALVGLGFLPTPQMTPSSVASSTPAASILGLVSRRSSMCSAMASIQRQGLCRSTTDQYPTYRQPSLAPSVSPTRSSPESMVSDSTRSSRSSRASSISSVSTTSTSAPGQACLARLATCRNAGLPLRCATDVKGQEGVAAEPIHILDETDIISSPDFASFNINDDRTTPVHSHPTCQPTSASSLDSRRKRTRSRGSSRDLSQLHDTVQSLLRMRHSNETVIISDDNLPSSPISPSAVREATMNLRRSPKWACVKGTQPPARLGRRSSNRVPVEKDVGRKRTCCSSEVQEPPRFVVGSRPGMWHGIL